MFPTLIAIRRAVRANWPRWTNKVAFVLAGLALLISVLNLFYAIYWMALVLDVPQTFACFNEPMDDPADSPSGAGAVPNMIPRPLLILNGAEHRITGSDWFSIETGPSVLTAICVGVPLPLVSMLLSFAITHYGVMLTTRALILGTFLFNASLIRETLNGHIDVDRDYDGPEHGPGALPECRSRDIDIIGKNRGHRMQSGTIRF